MDKIVKEIDVNVELDRNDIKAIATTVGEMYQNFDRDRETQLTIIDEVSNCLYKYGIVDSHNSTAKNNINHTKSTNDTYKNNGNKPLKDSSIKRILRTSLAHTYNSTFKNLNKLIGVELPDSNQLNRINLAQTMRENTDNLALIQKESLNSVIKKARPKKAFKKAISNWYRKGEIILKLNWEKEYTVIRRKEETILENGLKAKKWVYKQKLVYDGIKIECIDPELFVYDTSRIDDFDNAPKIQKKWMTYHDIINNDLYKDFMSKNDKDELKQELENSGKDNTLDHSGINEKEDMIVRDGLVEVLFYQGDFDYKTESGVTKHYSNLKIVVVGRKYVAFFGYNPTLINPYILCNYEVDEDTGRGVPLLASIVSNSVATTRTLNRMDKALGLSIIKPNLSPEGFFKKGAYKIEEGRTITYDDNSQKTLNDVMFLDFTEALRSGIPFLQFLKSETEEETGRFKYSSGDAPKKARTLGEVKIVEQGQNVINTFELDTINDEVIIPLFEKIGEMQANYQEGESEIKFVDKNNIPQTATMDEEIRGIGFTYTITDNQTSTDKKLSATEYTDILLGKIAPYSAQTGQGLLDVRQIINTIGSAYEQENPTSIIKEQQLPQQQLPQQGGNDIGGEQIQQGDVIPE